MSEEEAIARVTVPGTRESLTHDLRRLGLRPGQALIVHASLSALGWVNGGEVTLIHALIDALTPRGTLVMPAHTAAYSDPALWQNPPVPAAWQETIRATMPLFDPRRTPTRGIGRVAELFRTWPDVRRSAHPQVSFAAWGRHADHVTSGHELPFGLGESSPLARVYDLEGSVLLLGTGHDSNTSLHLSEARLPDPALTENGTPWMENGRRVWKRFPEIDYDSEPFPALGRAFEAQHDVTVGQVAAATSRLMSQRELVDFGVAWLAARAHDPYHA